MRLEDELFGIRAMRHVFRLKRNLSLQAWVTVLNPLMARGYPPQLLLTLERDLTEPTYPPIAATPESEEARQKQWWRGSRRP